MIDKASDYIYVTDGIDAMITPPSGRIMPLRRDGLGRRVMFGEDALFLLEAANERARAVADIADSDYVWDYVGEVDPSDPSQYNPPYITKADRFSFLTQAPQMEYIQRYLYQYGSFPLSTNRSDFYCQADHDPVDSVNPDWPLENLGVFEEHVSTDGDPASVSRPTLSDFLAEYPDFLVPLEPILKIGWSDAINYPVYLLPFTDSNARASFLTSFDQMQLLFRNQRKLTRFLDVGNKLSTFPAHGQIDAPTYYSNTTWDSDVRWVDGDPSTGCEVVSNFTYQTTSTFPDPDDWFGYGTAPWGSFSKAYPYVNYEVYVYDVHVRSNRWYGREQHAGLDSSCSTECFTRHNLPVGARVTPLVFHEVRQSAQTTYGSGYQSSAITDQYRVCRGGIIFANPKTVDGTGTVTFTWGDLTTSGGGSGSANRLWDDFSSLPPMHHDEIYKPAGPSSINLPPLSVRYGGNRHYVPNYTSYASGIHEIYLYGLLVDLSDHTKWWTD